MQKQFRFIFLLFLLPIRASCFTTITKTKYLNYSASKQHFYVKKDDNELSTSFDYANSETSSKTIVSTLTNIVNAIMTNKVATNSESEYKINDISLMVKC